jgi:hypothetical protein
MELIEKKLKFLQDSDSMQKDDAFQQLNVEVLDSGAGAYVVISTKRWSFDESDIDNFAKMLKKEIKNVGHSIKYNAEN